MGTIYTIGASVVCVMILSSCSKELDKQPAPQSQATAGQVLNVTINTDEVYSVSYDKATELSIHKQAAHFRESTTSVNNETGLVVYRYAPKEGFTGTDEVTLSSIKKVATYSSGCFRGNYGNEQDQMLEKIYTTVKIKVIR